MVKEEEYKIYLFRHGQTYHNRDGIFSGWLDTKLTKKGIEDAKIIAIRLKDKKIEVAFQTRLSRSKDTLRYILKYHPECKKIITDDRMIERSYGKLSGISHYNFIVKNSPKSYDIYHRSYNIPPPKGESIKQVEKRVLLFIKDLIRFIKQNKVNVAISAHGNSMRPFRRYFEKLTIKQMLQLENPYDNYFEYNIKI
ncbi:histidine phosphatase family protein [Candidatus Woesearchaeota archaeon]|nr:histidine phosphatase family protein [Candidatus Woesearchaeota archaeon]